MITPINNNILFKPFDGESVTDGGILIPDSMKQPSNRGLIVAVGHTVTTMKAGDIGFRVKDWGEEIHENGEKYFLMDAKAIIALQ